MKNTMKSMLAGFEPGFELNIPEPAGSAADAAPAPAAGSGQPGGTADPAPAASTPSPSDKTTPAAAAESFELKVDGQSRKVTREELVNLAQQGDNFTQKTQKLADERRRWEADRQAILQQERAKWDREQQEAAERRRAEELGDKDPALLGLERIQSLEHKIEDQALDSAIRGLSAKFPNMNEREFLIEANARGLHSAEDVARHGEQIATELAKNGESRFDSRFTETLKKGEHPELVKMKETWIAEYLQKKGSGPTPPSGGALTPALGGSPRRAKTFDEAADIAQEMLTGAPVA